MSSTFLIEKLSKFVCKPGSILHVSTKVKLCNLIKSIKKSFGLIFFFCNAHFHKPSISCEIKVMDRFVDFAISKPVAQMLTAKDMNIFGVNYMCNVLFSQIIANFFIALALCGPIFFPKNFPTGPNFFLYQINSFPCSMVHSFQCDSLLHTAQKSARISPNVSSKKLVTRICAFSIPRMTLDLL